MADSTKLLLIAAAGAAVYYFYFYNPSPATVSSAAGAAAPPAPPPPPNPNAITGANTLDGIYARLVSTAGSSPRGVDAWGFALGPLLPSGDAPPDPLPIFTAAVPGFDRSQNLTPGQYWAVMAPALKTQLGLSGLGVMGGLHALRGW